MAVVVLHSSGTGWGSSVSKVVCESGKEGKVPEDFCSDYYPGTAAVRFGFQVPPDPEVVILQGQRGHVLPGEVFLLHYFLQGCLQTIPLLTEFHREALNDGVIPASAREISSEKSKDLLEHHMDDQNGLLLL